MLILLAAATLFCFGCDATDITKGSGSGLKSEHGTANYYEGTTGGQQSGA